MRAEKKTWKENDKQTWILLFWEIGQIALLKDTQNKYIYFLFFNTLVVNTNDVLLQNRYQPPDNLLITGCPPFTFRLCVNNDRCPKRVVLRFLSS